MASKLKDEGFRAECTIVLHWASSFLVQHLSLLVFHYTVPLSFCLNV